MRFSTFEKQWKDILKLLDRTRRRFVTGKPHGRCSIYTYACASFCLLLSLSLLLKIVQMQMFEVSDKDRRRNFLKTIKTELEEGSHGIEDSHGIDCSEFLMNKKTLGTYFRPSDDLVSIITPVFNPKMIELRETMDCILSQTYLNWEWIIVDDFSAPTRSRELEIFSGQDYRIRFIKNSEIATDQDGPNLGEARNTGLEYSNGRYVFFLDGDDKIDPTTIEKMMRFLSIHENAHFVSAYVKAFGFSSYKWTGDTNPSWKFKEKNMIIATSLHRKHSLSIIGNYSNRKNGLEDWDTWLKYANANVWGGTIPETLLYVRKRKSNSDRWQDLTTIGKEKFREGIDAAYPKLSKTENWPVSPIERWKKIRNNPSIYFTRSKSKSDNSLHLVIIFDKIEPDMSPNFYVEFVSHLRRSNWKVTIVSVFSSQNTWIEAFRNVSPDLFFLNSLGSPLTFLNTISGIVNIRPIDLIILGHGNYGYKMLPYLRESLPNCAFVDVIHYIPNYWFNKDKLSYKANIDPYVDQIYVSSQKLKDDMVREGVKSRKLEIFYTGVNLEKWNASESLKQYSKKALGFSKRDHLVLTNMRLDPPHQPMLFVETVINVLNRTESKESSNLYFILLGSGTSGSKIKKIIGEQPKAIRDHIVYFNDLPHFLIPYITRAADISFLPSTVERIQESCYESMATGSVVLGFDVGGVNEVIENKKTGLLVRMNPLLARKKYALKRGAADFKSAVELFSTSISRLLSSKTFRDSLRNKAQTRIKKYSSKPAIKEMIASLEALIKKVRVSRRHKVINRDNVNSAISLYESLSE